MQEFGDCCEVLILLSGFLRSWDLDRWGICGENGSGWECGWCSMVIDVEVEVDVCVGRCRNPWETYLAPVEGFDGEAAGVVYPIFDNCRVFLMFVIVGRPSGEAVDAGVLCARDVYEFEVE